LYPEGYEMTPYYVEIFSEQNDFRIQLLTSAINQELTRLGVHRNLTVNIGDAPLNGEPAVGVYFGSSPVVNNSQVTTLLSQSLEASRAVIPVVNDLTTYASDVPDCLRPINGFAWSGQDSAERLCRKVLEELGIEDRQRRAFISHRREDGLAAAEQLHEGLSQNGFYPFIDRFHIAPGRNVQAEIADQLEDCALLLLIETPLAHTSEWVFDEVDYALSHQLGMHILTWPGEVTALPGTIGLPRQRLEESDLTSLRGYDIFTSDAMDRIITCVEAEHARAMVRRRRYLLISAEEAARDAGRECLPLSGWRMMVKGRNDSSVVQVTPRLPTVEDLYSLDEIRADFPEPHSGILIHAARRLPDPRRKVLAWAGESRDLALVPENAIGSYWRA
jgi:TIR domain